MPTINFSWQVQESSVSSDIQSCELKASEQPMIFGCRTTIDYVIINLRLIQTLKIVTFKTRSHCLFQKYIWNVSSTECKQCLNYITLFMTLPNVIICAPSLCHFWRAQKTCYNLDPQINICFLYRVWVFDKIDLLSPNVFKKHIEISLFTHNVITFLAYLPRNKKRTFHYSLDKILGIE